MKGLLVAVIVLIFYTAMPMGGYDLVKGLILRHKEARRLQSLEDKIKKGE